MKNKLPDLRDHLFATIEHLLDDEKPMETDRARAVAEVAHQLIESAKVEVQFLRVTGAGADESTGFIPTDAERPRLPRTVKRVGSW